MPESTMTCRLCPRTMPAGEIAAHLARHHPDGPGLDQQVEWWPGSSRPVIVDTALEPADFGARL